MTTFEEDLAQVLHEYKATQYQSAEGTIRVLNKGAKGVRKHHLHLLAILWRHGGIEALRKTLEQPIKKRDPHIFWPKPETTV